MSLYLKLALFGLAALFVAGVVGAGYWHVQSIQDDLKAAQSAVSELKSKLTAEEIVSSVQLKTIQALNKDIADAAQRLAELELDNGQLEESVGDLERRLSDLNTQKPGDSNEPAIQPGALTPEVLGDLNRLLDDVNRLLGATRKPAP